MLLTALAEPLVGDPLGADEDRAARVHGGLVARAVPEQLGKERGGKTDSDFRHHVRYFYY